jgi:hypothetical protein
MAILSEALTGDEMPIWNSQLDDEVLIDGSVPIAGVDNSQPPSAIGPTLAADAENRLTEQDGLNRPRPGIIRVAQTAAPTMSLDSVHHLGVGVFLINDGPKWYTYDSRSNVLTALSGGPAYAARTQVYSALADTVLYFSIGGGMSKYTPGTGFGTNVLLSQYPSALYPIWAVGRLVYAWKNTLVVSDILSPEVWDAATQSLQIDPIASDSITGQCVWQNQQIAVFRNGSTWVVETGPGLDVLNWELNRASATIGCCSHGTIVQCSADVYFLSETGRGVYALSQAPTSTQRGVWLPLSQPIKRYIDRINWSAIANARATYWNDLYLLSVPLDGVTYNNYVLIYSVTLGAWQGIWCLDINGVDTAVRDFARDRTNPDKTVLLIGSVDGILSKGTYPSERRYFDQNIDSSKTAIASSLLSKSFTFSEAINQIQPHSTRLQFLESDDPVDITIWADRTIELLKKNTPTNNYLLTLTIPGFPFDLDKEGYYNLPLSLMNTGICTELQVSLSGPGNWTLYQIKCSAFEAMPLESV